MENIYIFAFSQISHTHTHINTSQIKSIQEGMEIFYLSNENICLVLKLDTALKMK